MQKILDKFEQVIVFTLLAFMMIAVFLATIEVGVILWKQMMNPPYMLLDVKEIMEVFGFLLMVIIGLELLETIKAYLDKKVIHVEVVLLVALVAVARKVIILEYKDMQPSMLFAIAALVISLSAGFFIVRRALSENPVSRRRSSDN
ncbi:MAG: phosphate-starvation-inducible PsiE family protein [Pontiella sp.]